VTVRSVTNGKLGDRDIEASSLRVPAQAAKLVRATSPGALLLADSPEGVNVTWRERRTRRAVCRALDRRQLFDVHATSRLTPRSRADRPPGRGIAAAVAALVLAGCGLLDPPGPPARLVDGGGAAVPQAPAPGATEATPPFPGYALVWSDDFDGDALDPARWNIWRNRWHSAVNSPDAVVVNGGLLSLVTHTEPDGVHHAGHINTDGHLEATYGYFEARIRFGDSVGQWCSFFLYPTKTYGKPIGDPGNAGVEMDVFEHRQVDEHGFDYRDVIQVGLNWDGFAKDWKAVHRTLGHPTGEPLSHAWHTYAVLWTDAGVTYYIDDVPLWSTSAAISHRPEPIYLTCEVKDGAWDGFIPAGGYGPLETSTTRMDVDWVRVWQQGR
jgi:beta-glucanase (GH16 family)